VYVNAEIEFSAIASRLDLVRTFGLLAYLTISADQVVNSLVRFVTTAQSKRLLRRKWRMAQLAAFAGDRALSEKSVSLNTTASSQVVRTIH